MGLDIKVAKKINATYEASTSLYFADDTNPADIYRQGWKALENELLLQINLDGLKALPQTVKNNMYEGSPAISVVIVMQMEATNG